MEAPAMLISDEVGELSRLSEAPPVKFEEEELDLLAFEMWQLASCPDKPVDQGTNAAKEAWSHASAL